MFNCGKMEHIFEYVRRDKGSYYIDEFTSEDARQAFEEGEFYLKIHGECGLIDVQANKAYRRNQSKIIPENNSSLPSFANVQCPNPTVYRDEVYSLEEIPTSIEEIEKLKLGKKQKKMFIERANAYQTYKKEDHEKFIQRSVEWIGTKIQRTPGVIDQASFIIHENMNVKKIEQLNSKLLRSFENLKFTFSEFIIEGFVIADKRLDFVYKS